jgi:hypothetical protein
MSASSNDQPTRMRWRLEPIPVVTGVVIAAVVLAMVLSGCRGLFGRPGPTASSRSAAPSSSRSAAALDYMLGHRKQVDEMTWGSRSW